MNTQIVLSILQMILAFGNICIMAYAFSKFLARPHDTLEQRITNLESRVDDLEESRDQSTDKFKEQTSTNEVIIHSVLALIEFEMQYCISEHKTMSPGLEKAKEDLHTFLSKK